MSRIVILGGGFGGIRVALDLAKFLPKGKITLVNKTPYHCYHADLYQVAATKLSHEGKLDFKHLVETTNLSLKKIFQGKNIDLLISEVLGVDLESKIITLNDQTLNYDILVLAYGSTTNYFGITGAKEYSHPLKSTEDALNIHNDLEELSQNKKKLKVVIAGGGFTGVELACQLVKFLPGIKFSTVEASDKILTGMPEWAQDEALAKLKNLGIEVMLSSEIKEVKEDLVVTQQRKITFDYLIWTTGIKGMELKEGIKGVEFNSKGQIEVESSLSLKGHPEVFVVGDLASIKDTPATAYAAIAEGKIAALNIKNTVMNKHLTAFSPPQSAFVVPLGRKYGVANIFNLKLTGFLPWLIKHLITLKYLLSTLPLPGALLIWWEDLKFYD